MKIKFNCNFVMSGEVECDEHELKFISELSSSEMKNIVSNVAHEAIESSKDARITPVESEIQPCQDVCQGNTHKINKRRRNRRHHKTTEQKINDLMRQIDELKKEAEMINE